MTLKATLASGEVFEFADDTSVEEMAAAIRRYLDQAVAADSTPSDDPENVIDKSVASSEPSKSNADQHSISVEPPEPPPVGSLARKFRLGPYEETDDLSSMRHLLNRLLETAPEGGAARSVLQRSMSPPREAAIGWYFPRR